MVGYKLLAMKNLGNANTNKCLQRKIKLSKDFLVMGYFKKKKK